MPVGCTSSRIRERARSAAGRRVLRCDAGRQAGCVSDSQMLARLGFVASVLTEDLSTSRTCRLKNATPDRLRDLTAGNLSELDRVLTFLEKRRIRLYRITSNLIPFASHPVNTTRWWEEFADPLRRLGDRIRTLGIRVSTHPGQYTVLNSPHEGIVRAAVAELVYHARLLDALGTDPSSKIVLHIGGLYADSEHVAIERFCLCANRLPDEVRRRLVIENDDRLFDVDEVLGASRVTGLPVVFDWLHHLANPCTRPIEDVLPEVFETWKARDGRPKVHLSSQSKRAPSGAHADFVRPADMEAFMQLAPAPFDCMLEAKQKDRALLRLRRQLQARGIAETDILPVRARG